MEREICSEEGRLMEAMRRGPLNAELERHAAQCASCGDALAIAQFLAEPGEPVSAVPAWGLIYWKAELRARREQAERAMRPMQQMQIAAIIAMLVLVIAAGAISGVSWAPVAAVGLCVVLGGALFVVRRMLLHDS